MDYRERMDDHARRRYERAKRHQRLRRLVLIRRTHGNPPGSWFRMMRNVLRKLCPWWPEHTLTVVDLNSHYYGLMSPEIFFAKYGLNGPKG